MANLLINAVAGIASIAVPLGELGSRSAPAQSCLVQIGIGSGLDSMGGSVPHVALWDEDGNRIGQYHGDANGHNDPGTVQVTSISNDQAGGKAKQPEYLMLTMNESDAICVAFIVASGDGAQWTWLGDMGKTCGADWYYSTFKVGDGTYTPSCVWIDQDHSNGLKSQGFSLHMPDFSGQDGRAQQYQDTPDSLCKSNERMTFWYDIVADALIPTFSPPLKYAPNGADMDLKKVIDRDTNAYPHAKRRAVRDRVEKRGSKNIQKGHLVVSSNPMHSAKQLCDHPNSKGPDFVSTSEGIYCDMETSEWWNLCSAAVTNGCFDLDKKTMRGNAPGHKGLNGRDMLTGRDIPKKDYKTVNTWDS